MRQRAPTNSSLEVTIFIYMNRSAHRHSQAKQVLPQAQTAQSNQANFSRFHIGVKS